MLFDSVGGGGRGTQATGLPTGLARGDNRFAVGRGDCKAGHTTGCVLLRAFPRCFTGTNSASTADKAFDIGQKEGIYAKLSHEAYKTMPKLVLQISGQAVTFLVDSGATESVIIEKEFETKTKIEWQVYENNGCFRNISLRKIHNSIALSR